MKYYIFAALLAALLLVSIAYSDVNVSVQVLCWNATLNVTSDKDSYEPNEVAQINTSIQNYDSESINLVFVTEVYDVDYNLIKVIGVENVSIPSSSYFSTNYTVNLSDLIQGAYIVRSSLMSGQYYPVLNITYTDCLGIKLRAEKNITVISPLDVNYSEGLYELTGMYLLPVTLNTTTIVLPNLTAQTDDKIFCEIVKSDGSKAYTNKTFASNVTNSTEFLNYTIQPGDSSGAYETSWYVNYCELERNDSAVAVNIQDYPIYVKSDLWYFISGGLYKSNDAANAYISKTAAARSYFSHDDATDLDILFAVYKYSGAHYFEGICNDEIDNDADGLTDCADSDCKTIFFPSCGHAPELGPKLGTFSIKSIGTLALPSTNCTGNICAFSVGGANVWYTQLASPTGYFKVKVERLITTPEITFVTVKNITSTAFTISNPSTSIYGPNPLAYKWILPSDGPPFYTFTASSKQNASSTQTFSGNLEMVMSTLLTSPSQVAYLMNLDVFVGSGQGNSNFSFFVDAIGPENIFENDTRLQHVTTHYITGTQKTADQACNDGIDNDLNYDNLDCADLDCIGKQIGITQIGDPIYCESSETVCWDNFDNDADGLVDCADPNCNNHVGGYVLPNGTVAKYYIVGAQIVMCDSPEGQNFYSATPSSCADNFDNDVDSVKDCYDTTACWGRGLRNTSTILYPCPKFENNNISWCNDGMDNDFDRFVYSSRRAGYATNIGADCDDYDCHGAPNCPSIESFGNMSRCFDNIDNDIDKYFWNNTLNDYQRNSSTGTDCEDPDCAWAINPTNNSQRCVPTEFNFNLSYNLCNNGRDDDLDSSNLNGGMDCLDRNGTWNNTYINNTDCWATFVGCGPCSVMENIIWNACANNRDDDNDNGAGSYDTNPSSGVDCADTDCAGEIGNTTNAQRCGAEICNDSFDNNANGLTDCLDPACAGQIGPNGGICGNENTPTLCNDDVDNDMDGKIDCIDSGCWGIGVCAAKTWSSGSCLTIPSFTNWITLNPSGDIQMQYNDKIHNTDNFTIKFKNIKPVSQSIIVIVLGQYPTSPIPFNITSDQIVLTGSSAGSFSKDWTNNVLTLTNTTPISTLDLIINMPHNSSLGSKSFPILSQSQSGQGNGNIALTIYESSAPSITKIEIEPGTSPVNISYNSPISLRAIPTADSSGICRCDFIYNGVSISSSDSDCTITLPGQTADIDLFNVSARAVDGAANTGSYFDAIPFTLRTFPIQLYFNDIKKFSKQDLDEIKVSSAFITATGNTFSSTCNLTIRNDTHYIYSTLFPNIGSWNIANCTGTIDIPLNVPARDGIYYVTTSTVDTNGNIATSQKRVFYMCDKINSSGPGWTCKRADFDNDSYTEGITNPFFSNRVCDNCINLYNPNQSDADFDGIGDICDNCVNMYNPDQKDSDKDGVGDACEKPSEAGGGGGGGAPITSIFNITMPSMYKIGENMTIPFTIINKVNSPKFFYADVEMYLGESSILLSVFRFNFAITANQILKAEEFIQTVECNTAQGPYKFIVNVYDQNETLILKKELTTAVEPCPKLSVSPIADKSAYYLNENGSFGVLMKNAGNVEFKNLNLYVSINGPDKEYYNVSYSSINLRLGETYDTTFKTQFVNWSEGYYNLTAVVKDNSLNIVAQDSIGFELTGFLIVYGKAVPLWSIVLLISVIILAVPIVRYLKVKEII